MNMLDIREIKRRKEMEEKGIDPERAEELEQEQETREETPEFSRPQPPKSKAGKAGKALIFVGVFFIIIGVIFSNGIVAEKSNQFFNKIPVIGQIKHLVESSDKELRGEKNDRINILLLGMGGKGHQGSYLADTIILGSIKPSTKEVAMISIPRDLTVPIDGIGRRKINAVNAYAESEEKGSGGRATAQTLEGLLDIPIHYYARADFQGFINVVNRLGGVDIYVEKTLDDYKYPVMGKEDAENYNSRYEHLHIEKGWQHMDGELALKYVRSRHAQGPQGSDFSRARRQQKLLHAVKEKFKSTDLLMKPSLIMDVMKELDNHVSTNMEIWEIIKLWNMGKDIQTENIIRQVLEPGPQGLLRSYTSTSTGYILLPKGGDFEEVQYMVKNIFSQNKDQSQQKEKVEDATLEIRNGTWINGLAGRSSIDLEKQGFQITRVGNSEKKNFQKSVIYDLTFGNKLEPLKVLKEETDANVAFSIPDWLQEDIKEDVAKDNISEKPDFLLILGQSASNKY